jgi:predicted nucleotidyltransferase
MKKKAVEIAKKLKEKLKKYTDFEGLYLYGSQVTGKTNKYSDIDICAVFKKNKDYSREVLHDAYQIELDNDIILDFHPMTLEQLNENWFYFNEIKKGVYYAR